MSEEKGVEVHFFGGIADGTTQRIHSDIRNGRQYAIPIPPFFEPTYLPSGERVWPKSNRYDEELYSLYLISTNPEYWVAYDLRTYRSISDFVTKVLHIHHKIREMSRDGR